MVRIVLSIPMSQTAFNIERQTALKTSVARAAMVSIEDVSIANIEALSSGRRRLLTDSIRAEIHVKAADKEIANQIAGRLTAFRINSELAKVGLPAVVVTEPASVQEASAPESASSITPNSGSSSNGNGVIIGLTVTALTVVLGVIAACVWQHQISLSVKRPLLSSSRVAPVEAEPDTEPAWNHQVVERNRSVGADADAGAAGTESIVRADPVATDAIAVLMKMFQEMSHLLHGAPWGNVSAWWLAVHEEISQIEGAVSLPDSEEAANLMHGFHAQILTNGQNRMELKSVFIHMSATKLLSISDVPELSADRPVGWALCSVRPMVTISPTQTSRLGAFRFSHSADDASNDMNSQWQEAMDPQTSEVFYYHPATLETQSDPPAVHRGPRSGRTACLPAASPRAAIGIRA